MASCLLSACRYCWTEEEKRTRNDSLLGINFGFPKGMKYDSPSTMCQINVMVKTRPILWLRFPILGPRYRRLLLVPWPSLAGDPVESPTIWHLGGISIPVSAANSSAMPIVVTLEPADLTGWPRSPLTPRTGNARGARIVKNKRCKVREFRSHFLTSFQWIQPLGFSILARRELGQCLEAPTRPPHH